MPDKKECKSIIMSYEEYAQYCAVNTADSLEDIVNKQRAFAKKFHSLFIQAHQKFVEDAGSATTRAVTNIIQQNLAGITNEVEEIREWLPWKHWKQYQGFDVDLEEMRLEYIDLLHFVIEGCILLGMDSSDIHRYYASKMKENLARQERGY